MDCVIPTEIYNVIPYCCIVAKPQLIHTFNSIVANYLKDPKLHRSNLKGCTFNPTLVTCQ